MAIGPSNWLINSQWDAALTGIPFVVNQPYVQFHSADPGSGGTSNIIAIDRQAAFFERDTDGHWRTAGAPLEVSVDVGTDVTITHISIHDAFSAGNWMINMVGNQPILVVNGDLLTLSDRIQWTVTDWVS
ncbi:Gp34 protein [Mycolicibacterium canariasense]|uniref:Gp34 protein n=1 Tax=Mycolicibacterium canariasense TaxID=228230 RepID=A0A100WBJ8_MYCCR|nr:hypothetical protein [Mycolicibacterium canariasense]MCV7212675.1 hypothetical protein [Mycolicibacterium canariasense]ORV02490.1 hypothetical protein AWB94_00695 [Mycolicibacterium canariasense]GAS95452.1 Gp34 protein [Mycolicibacterium canariasense]